MDGKSARNTYRLVFFGSCVWWLFPTLPLELLQQIAAIGSLGAIAVGCFLLAKVRRPFAYAGMATAVFGVMVAVGFVVEVPSSAYLVLLLAWQWLLLEGVRHLPLPRRPGLATQVRVVQVGLAVLLVFALLSSVSPGEPVGTSLGVRLVGGMVNSAWSIITLAMLVTMHQVGRSIATLMRPPRERRLA